jgi:diguanylate cyclase (GGDEF)-like protein
VNDSYGHETGDNVLQCIAGAILGTIREVDIAARLGGEEFGILLPNTKIDSGTSLAERLRGSVEEKTCAIGDKMMGVTVSIGIAEYEKEMHDLDALLRNADEAMYKAKSLGRNRVVSWSSLSGQ